MRGAHPVSASAVLGTKTDQRRRAAAPVDAPARADRARPEDRLTIRLLQAIGPHCAQDSIHRFRFEPKMQPAYLTMALGAGSATPVKMAAAY